MVSTTIHERFAHHPGAREAPAAALVHHDHDANAPKTPTLRGWPLVVASHLVGNRGWVQKLIWEQAKFGLPARLAALKTEFTRLTPTVIPLSPRDAAQPPSRDTAELRTPQPPTLPGRFHAAADYHALYASGTATPLHVVDVLLPLLRGAGSPYAVAWRWCDVARVRAAAEASTKRWAAGRPLGLLDGVPIGIKDDIPVEGYLCSIGMRVDETQPFFCTPATETWWPVKKMQEAGAIVVGKNAMHEIGMDTSGCNPATGTPTNWYNTAYYPGGSSSGAASALSAGLVPICLGTDAGGSVRIPASFCGMYSLKPTHDRTIHMDSSMCVVGPMAATVSDLTAAYRTMSQPDHSCPVSAQFAPSLPPSPGANKHLGLCDAWIQQSSPTMQAALHALVAHLTSQCGYEPVAIQLPYLAAAQLAHGATCLTEATDHARTRVADPGRALALLNHANRLLLGAGSQASGADLLVYGKLRQVLMQHLAHLFARHPGLLVVTPTVGCEGWPRHPADEAYGFTDADKTILTMKYVWCANTTGCPAVQAPMGYAAPQQGEGSLPMGVQALGEWGAEEQLLVFAKEVEHYLNHVYQGGRVRPTKWVDVIGLARDATAKK